VENGPPTDGQIIVGAFFAPLSHTPWDQGGGVQSTLEDLPWRGGGPDRQ
jgi:hypothetical protein